MAIHVQWKMENGSWLTIDPSKHNNVLDPEQKYRLVDYTKKGVDFQFTGDMWDENILKDEKSFAYWLGYHGFKSAVTYDVELEIDNDAFYEGSLDRINAAKSKSFLDDEDYDEF